HSFANSDGRKKKKKDPSPPADISADITPEKPCDSGNCQYNERGQTPAVIGRAGPPRTSQNEQRRNDGKEKKDVIEIQSERKKVTKVTSLHRFAALTSFHFNFLTFVTFLTFKHDHHCY